jgi:hypothetical protein
MEVTLSACHVAQVTPRSPVLPVIDRGVTQEISTPERATLARFLHLLVAVLALGGFAIELVTAIVGGPGVAPTHAERMVRLFSYFTIESNLLIGGVSVALALDPRRDGPVFRVLRLDALLCIAVTGIVYNTMLRGLVTLTASGAVANTMLHVLAPPRGGTRTRSST